MSDSSFRGIKLKKFLGAFWLVFLAGCAQHAHVDFYSQVAPSTYPKTSNVMIFGYSNIDLDEIYELLFNDFLVIGKSAFVGSYEDPSDARKFAMEIGADVFISSYQFKETRTSFISLATPTVSTTSFSGYTGTGSFYGTATTYGTTTQTIPISVNRYLQNGIYLKNIDGVHPLWERTSNEYQETSPHVLSGYWLNDSYKINIVQSGEQMVAFVQEVLEGDKSWEPGQLKFVFGVDSKVGLYLMGSKMPVPSRFSVNKFGHLEVELLTSGQSFSFAPHSG